MIQALVDRVLLRADAAGPGNWADMWLPVRTAEARWRKYNRNSRDEGCRCGQPATVVARTVNVVGKVPFELWTCEDHKDEAGIWAA